MIGFLIREFGSTETADERRTQDERFTFRPNEVLNALVGHQVLGCDLYNRALGLEENPDALPVTFHTLRHVYVNRLLVLGVELIEIARSLGHTDTDTSSGSYLHAFDSLQEERLKEVLATEPEDGVTAVQIGALLGVKRAAVLAALKQLPAAEREGWQRGERHLYPWATVVQLLARRLRMEDVRSPGRPACARLRSGQAGRRRRASAPSTGQLQMALGV